MDLHLERGDFVTIVGSNGAGKSTLFNAIAGSFLVDSGCILVDGQDITFMAEHKRSKHIGRLFQDPMRGTAPHMTIEENLTLAAGSGGWFAPLTQKDKQRFRTSWLCWIWDWRTESSSRWGCCPADSARP